MGTFCKVCSLFRYLFSFTRVNTVNRQQSRIWLHCDNFLLRPHSLIFFMDMVALNVFYLDRLANSLFVFCPDYFIHALLPNFPQEKCYPTSSKSFLACWTVSLDLLRIVYPESLWFIEYDCCHRLWSWISKAYLGSRWPEKVFVCMCPRLYVSILERQVFHMDRGLLTGLPADWYE
jgi:hypothetical protein